MVSAEEELRIRNEIVAYLRDVQRYTEQDFCNIYGLDGRVMRLLVWEAREMLQSTDGIVFGVIPGWPGTFQRLDWSQMERQARRQRSAGTRKHRRAEAKLRIASNLAPDQSKERLSDAADRIALRLAMRAART